MEQGTFPPPPPPPSAFRHPWDNKSLGRTIESIDEEPGNPGGSGTGSRPRTRGFTTSSSGRHTTRWPFHSLNNSRSSLRYQPSLAHSRGGSFQHSRTDSLPRRAADSINRSVSSVLGSEIIPDYVVNFLRGETPESLARKRGMMLPDSPDTANFPHHYGNESPRPGSFRPGSRAGTPRAEMEKMLRDQGEPNTTKRLTSGWRGGVSLNILQAFLLFAVTIVCVGLAGAKGHISGGGSAILEDAQRKLQGANWGIHAIVNIFSIAIIAGTNYVFQVLSSPTRPEVDAAHDNLKWLDIGIPSLRNFGLISPARAGLSGILIGLAFVSQIIYNSLIFTTYSASVVNVALVSTSFVNSSSLSSSLDLNGMSRSDLLNLQSKAKAEDLVKLTVSECIATFDNSFQTIYDGVLLISKSGSDSLEIKTAEPGTLVSAFLKSIDESSDSVDYCLADPVTDMSSSLILSGPLLGLMVFLNLVFILALAIVLALAVTRHDFNPLVTLGDALSSFLEEPDPTTRNSCLMTKAEVKKGEWGQREAKFWTKQPCSWMYTPSIARWAAWFLTWMAPLGLAAAALAFSLKASPDGFSSFGEATLVSRLPDGPRIGLAIVVALPQILLGVLYFSTNALLSVFFLSHEMSMFMAPGRLLPLRVSSGRPIGAQTSTIHLTVPRVLSWVLFLLTAGMGFLLSQGVALVAVDRDDGTKMSGIGFSPIPLLLLVIVLVLLGLLILSLSLRSAYNRGAIDDGEPAGNPLALLGGTCSAVLSSRCHREPREDGVEALAVRWGVVREGVGMAPGHATFSARPVGDVTAGRSYA
ncbi:hypothetical protein BGZ63DRAFT_403884 [Mariannaea sp. PMI_226]|nr:hypothetical protein BGZ63DRAFT_403884 [Mariannaea sp. PMI_226]